MKNLIKTLLLLSIISQGGCKDDPIDKNSKIINFKFNVWNKSSMNLSILLYYPSNELFKEQSLNQGDSVLLDEGVINPVGGASYSLTNSLDSAVIRFSDGRELIQTFYERGNNDTVNNILSSLFYEREQLSETATVMKFTISEQDYLRAK